MLLKPSDGGPSVYWPIVVPAGTKGTAPVPLPAMSISQPYDVCMLDDGGPFAKPIAIVNATITWPADVVHKDFLSADYDPPAWPWTVKRNVVIILALGVLAMTATVLIGRGSRANSAERQASVAVVHNLSRVVIPVAILIASVVAVAWYLHSLDAVVQGRVLSPTTAQGQIITVGAFRSTTWAVQADLVPIYQTQAQLREDRLIIQPHDRLWLPLAAGETRLFRRGG